MRFEDLGQLALRDERRASAILGLAVGDALGAAYEFCSPEDVPEGSLEVVGGGLVVLATWRDYGRHCTYQGRTRRLPGGLSHPK